MSHVSTVPNNSSPASARCLACGTWSNTHFTFVAEKYGSKIRPVFCWIISLIGRTFPSASVIVCPSNASQYSAVLRHCQTIALQIGCPFFLSQMIVVSRWFVIPIAAISSAVTLILDIASTATPSCVDQISFASCSTQPGCGNICVNSFCAILTILPLLSNKIQRLLVVPASSAII